jgi:hypothetical protein
MTRARARQLNYQVKSFLAVHTNSSHNWMLLNHGDDCLILRNVGQDSIASCLDPMMRMEQPNKWESSLMGRIAHLETARDPMKLVFELLERARHPLSHGSNPTIRIYQSCVQQAKGCRDLQLGPGPCTNYNPLRDAQIRVSHSPLCSPPYK